MLPPPTRLNNHPKARKSPRDMGPSTGPWRSKIAPRPDMDHGSTFSMGSSRIYILQLLVRVPRLFSARLRRSLRLTILATPRFHVDFNAKSHENQ